MNDYWTKEGLHRIRAEYQAGNITKHQAQTIRGQFLKGQLQDIERTLSRTIERNRAMAQGKARV